MNLSLKIKKIWWKLTSKKKSRPTQKRVMTEDEMLDQSLKETFPASDSPGYRAKSTIDFQRHTDIY